MFILSSLKGKDVERVNKLVYLIKLKTEGGQNKEGFVQFTCTEEQLQVSVKDKKTTGCDKLTLWNVPKNYTLTFNLKFIGDTGRDYLIY